MLRCSSFVCRLLMRRSTISRWKVEKKIVKNSFLDRTKSNMLQISWNWMIFLWTNITRYEDMRLFFSHFSLSFPSHSRIVLVENLDGLHVDTRKHRSIWTEQQQQTTSKTRHNFQIYSLRDINWFLLPCISL